MAIAVACKCGKQMKVKDELAGKAVRCPACKSPLRIPGPVAAGKKSKSAKGRAAAAPGVDEQAALMKFQEAQKKKQVSAEEEAAYRAEQNKLIESYDQLTGRATPSAKEEKKKGQLAEAKIKKPTVFTKIADAFGAVFGTFAFKYIMIAVLLGGGALGSVYVVRFVTGYMHDETESQMSNKDRARLRLQQAQEDVARKMWEEARIKLDDVIRLDNSLKINREYLKLRGQVDKALAKPPK